LFFAQNITEGRGKKEEGRRKREEGKCNKNMLRRLKPLLNKQSPPARTEKRALKPDLVLAISY
jgi:hypothetical protein